MCEICLKLTIKTLNDVNGVVMVPLLFHVEYISHFVPGFLLLTLNRQMPTVFPSHPHRQQIAQGLQIEVREILLEFNA